MEPQSKSPWARILENGADWVAEPRGDRMDPVIVWGLGWPSPKTSSSFQLLYFLSSSPPCLKRTGLWHTGKCHLEPPKTLLWEPSSKESVIRSKIRKLSGKPERENCSAQRRLMADWEMVCVCLRVHNHDITMIMTFYINYIQFHPVRGIFHICAHTWGWYTLFLCTLSVGSCFSSVLKN